MERLWITKLLSLFGVKLKLKWPVKPKRDKYEENDEIVRKCKLLKAEIDEMSLEMRLLAMKPTKESAEKMDAMNKRASRIIRHLHRYRRHQINLMGC